jgi:hypothetical protein
MKRWKVGPRRDNEHSINRLAPIKKYVASQPVELGIAPSTQIDIGVLLTIWRVAKLWCPVHLVPIQTRPVGPWDGLKSVGFWLPE